jgi:hypothetical protein
MTYISSKLVRSSHYIVLSAGFLLQAHSAFANEPIGDAQARARALLDPPVVRHVIGVETSASTQANDRAAHPDAQALARALLLGQSKESGAAQTAIVRDSKAPGAPSHSTQDRRAYFDPQEAARLMILGSGTPVVAATKITVSER